MLLKRKRENDVVSIKMSLFAYLKVVNSFLVKEGYLGN